MLHALVAIIVTSKRLHFTLTTAVYTLSCGHSLLRVCSGPMLALVLEKEDAVEKWRELLGPMELDVAQIEAPERFVM